MGGCDAVVLDCDRQAQRLGQHHSDRDINPASERRHAKRDTGDRIERPWAGYPATANSSGGEAGGQLAGEAQDLLDNFCRTGPGSGTDLTPRGDATAPIDKRDP